MAPWIRVCLAGHPNYEPHQFFACAWPTGSASLEEGPLACHQFPVPAKQRLGRDDRAKLAEHLPPDRPRLLGKVPTLRVSEDDAPFPEPLAKQAVLSLQVFDHPSLLPVQPTGDQHKQELKQSRGSRHPGRDVGCTTLPRQPSRPNCYPGK